MFINKRELQGRINSEFKERMVGAKANYLTIFFMIKWEGDPINKRDGTTFKPSVSCAVTCGGKLAEKIKTFKKGDLITVIGSFRVDVKLDDKSGLKTYFPKIEAESIEALVQQVEYADESELPW